MPDLFYGLGAYARERGNLPELPVVNMTVEQSPSAERGVVLQSRPGLELDSEVGPGPIAGIFRKDGAFGGDRFVVSGGALYRNAKRIGAISGSGPVTFTASPDKLLVARSGSLHSYNGTTLTTEALPDAGKVAAVAYIAGYEIATIAGTNKFFFRQYTETSFDGLDFANASNEPDRLLDAIVIDDQVAFFGSETVEFWFKTGDATAPLQPVSGRVFEKGLYSTGAATRFDNTLAWVSNEGIVYIAANVPQRISDNGIEERIARSETVRVFSFFFEGIEYLVLRLDSSTWILSAASRQWSEFTSYNQPNWRACCAITGPIFGDAYSGKLWRYSDGHRDDGGPLERRFRAAIPISGAATIQNLRLVANVGETPDLVGVYADPIVEMRTSRDAARTFSGWRATKLGEQGKYRTRVEWRRCGMFDDPGMVAEFRVTDPVPFRVSSVKANEPGGGRGR